MTIRVTATVVSARVVDRPPKGQLNKGDAIHGKSVLRNSVAQFGRPRGSAVGSDSEVATFLSAQTALVTGVAELPGGSLRIRGKQVVNRTAFVLNVVGGTGKFANARGRLEVQALTATRSSNIYRLNIP